MALDALPFVVMLLVYITTTAHFPLRWSTRFGACAPRQGVHAAVQRRQTSIKSAFSDALKLASEVGGRSLELAEELSLKTAELTYLQDRRRAFENLGKRTGIPGIKAVAPMKLTVAMIIFFLPVQFVVILVPAIIQVFGYQ